jgi:cytochrome c-type biogenesis protein CcmH
MSVWSTVLFWTVAALLSAGAGWLLLTLARRRAAGGDETDPGVAMHRRQLAEIDDLVARGLLNEAETAEVRAEAGKRLLAADEAARPRTLAGGRNIVLAAAVLAPLAAFGLYVLIGSPGRADAPMKARIAAWSRQDESTLTPQQIAAALTEVSKTRKGDAALLSLLAENRRLSGDLFGAARALREAVGIEPGNPQLWAQLGEIYVWTTNGEVGGDARAAFNQALRLDARNLSARYYLGLAEISDGRPAAGHR